LVLLKDKKIQNCELFDDYNVEMEDENNIEIADDTLV